jgi:mannosyltransferase OCH1-like enzyme
VFLRTFLIVSLVLCPISFGLFFGDNVIPKKLHIVWIGDESKRPDNCINTWIKMNPDYVVKVWGNDDLYGHSWINGRHMTEYWDRELCGVADMMRWEILYDEGGIALDADCICKRPLEDWLLEASVFAGWESELDRFGLIANSTVGAEPGNPFIGQIIQDIKDDKPDHRMAWEFCGPVRITQTWLDHAYTGITIHPSHYFLPRHFAGSCYTGKGIVFADQMWGSTRSIYNQLHEQAVEERE